jgi:hypothetical protein
MYYSTVAKQNKNINFNYFQKNYDVVYIIRMYFKDKVVQLVFLLSRFQIL